ncbi:putative spermidine/putrescine transport system permease protein [Seinonella peptonophila]|uniref:Putative spermidine/putrescine transport system permease protein n=1 Tax=Seinonella peptonophila TaxID=112248 RepID=A0A1M5BK35_9BACL|nr:ABC transporter permease [Seinonella peptonophila]SHF42829.1 putative spermidine/putrescine transport system permease protein [Seinonella peptonophila]
MIGKVASRLVIFMLFLFLALPLIVLIATSFTEAGYLSFPPEGFTFKWYLEVLRDTSYLDSFAFSFYLALLATAISIVIGVPTAQILARHDFFGKRLIEMFLSSSLLLPQIVFGVALLQFFSYFVAKPQSFWVLTLGHIVLTLPYIIRTCLASFIGLGKSLEEAGQDLGANRIKTFVFITLPLIKPSVIAGGLFAFAISWINVEVTIFLSASNQMALPVKMFNYVQYNVDPMIAAVSALTIYLAFILIVIIDYFVELENIAAN